LPFISSIVLPAAAVLVGMLIAGAFDAASPDPDVLAGLADAGALVPAVAPLVLEVLVLVLLEHADARLTPASATRRLATHLVLIPHSCLSRPDFLGALESFTGRGAR
jgi:hypothetical protein